MSKQPDNNPLSVYGMVAGIAGQMGCLLSVTVIGSLLLGLFLDQILGTKPILTFVLLLASVPLNIWMIFRYTQYKANTLQDSPEQKEDDK